MDIENDAEQEDYPGDDLDGEDEFDEALDTCGMTSDGSCMLAGTEQCDFQCPISRSMYANLARKRDKKGRSSA